MKAGRFTSISNEGRNNYQRDYAGHVGICVEYFGDECVRNGVKWAHLFEESTGKMVASFNAAAGLVLLENGDD